MALRDGCADLVYVYFCVTGRCGRGAGDPSEYEGIARTYLDGKHDQPCDGYLLELLERPAAQRAAHRAGQCPRRVDSGTGPAGCAGWSAASGHDQDDEHASGGDEGDEEVRQELPLAGRPVGQRV